MAKETKSGPKLPVQQLVILAMVRFAEPLALTSVFPYLPEMIKSFGVPKEEVAKWAGMTSAVFSVAQSLTAVPWGWTSDRIGRKPTIIIGLICTMVCFLFWGSSTSLLMAITVRGIQGASNGNVGTIRTMVAEMVPQKTLQPRAFSIMPMVWSLGSTFGPSFGGFFARPAEQFPSLFGNMPLFKTFPFLLPNLIALVFFVFSAANAFLFLEETLESRKHKTDWGIELGERLMRIFRRGKPSKRSLLRARARARAWERAQDRARRLSLAEDGLRTPLLSASALQSETDLSLGAAKPPTAIDDTDALAKVAAVAAAVSAGAPADRDDAQAPLAPPPTQRPSVFTYQTSMTLLCYTILALHSVAFDQVLPVFLNYPYEKHDASNTHLPFKFSGGFGLSSDSIGTMFTVNALISGFMQFVAFPPLCTRFGPLNCYRFACIVLPFVYILTPYSTLLPNAHLRYALFMAVFITKGILTVLTFPCIIIILTNAAPSVKILGLLNGYATLVSGIGRSLGPAITGATFSWGVHHGYIIAGWAFLAAVATLGAIASIFLQEGDGLEEPAKEGTGRGEELAEEPLDSESGGLAYGYAATDDASDGDYYDDEEAVLLGVAQDDDEYYIHGTSSRPHAHGHAGTHRRPWSGTSGDEPPLPVPTASHFNNTLHDGTVSIASELSPMSPSQQRGPHLAKLQVPSVRELREPDDPGSESDLDVADATGFGTSLPLDSPMPPSPSQTRRL